MPYVALEHVDSRDPVVRRTGRASDARSAKFRFQRGDVLYSKLRPYLDKGVLADFEGVASTEFLVLRAKDGVDPSFLVATMHSPPVLARAIATTGGVNHPRTSWTSLAPTLVYAPPLTEQQRITRILSTIRDYAEAVAAAVRSKSELANAMAVHLLEGIGGPQLAIGDVLASAANGIYKPQSNYGASGLPIVRINDFPNQGGVISSAPLRVLVSDGEMERFSAVDGDILVNRVNSLSHLGKVALIEGRSEPLLFESNMMRLRVKRDAILPRFLFYWLCTPLARNHMRRCAKRAVAQSSINQGDVAAVPLDLPSVDRQVDIVAKLDAVHRSLQASATEDQAVGTVEHAALKALLGGDG
jgi:type I restriction enzyme S subunit